MVKEILINDKFIVYQYDNFNFTGLHLCARRMNWDIAILLLEHNADPDSKDFVILLMILDWKNPIVLCL